MFWVTIVVCALTAWLIDQWLQHRGRVAAARRLQRIEKLLDARLPPVPMRSCRICERQTQGSFRGEDGHEFPLCQTCWSEWQSLCPDEALGVRPCC